MKISVAMCTYNGEKYIRQQLDSILHQTLNVDEIIICDDKSTDGTYQILKEYQLKYPEVVSVYLNEISLFTIKNFEQAVSKCAGDWIFLSDQDDMWKPFKVKKMVDFVNTNPATKLLFTDGNLIDEKNQDLGSTLWKKWSFDEAAKKRWKINKGAFNDLLYNKNYVTGATAMISRSLVKDIIPIQVPENYFHDSWFAINAAAQNGLAFLEEPLISYRVHPDQQVGITKEKKETSNTGKSHLISREEYIKQLQEKYFKPSVLARIYQQIFAKK